MKKYFCQKGHKRVYWYIPDRLCKAALVEAVKCPCGAIGKPYAKRKKCAKAKLKKHIKEQ